MFTRADVAWLSESVRELHTARTIGEFAKISTAALDRRFSLLASAMEEVGLTIASYTLHHLRTAVPAPRDHAAFFHDNPFTSILARGALPPLLHMRGRFAFAKWQRTDHYNGIARPMGWNDQAMIVGQERPNLVIVAAHRDSRFSGKEIALMELLQPHISAVWQRVNDPHPRVTDPGRLHVRLTPGLQPVDLDARHRVILAAYFPGWKSASGLPAPLRDWVIHSVRELRTEPPPHPLRAFAADSPRGRLLVRCFPGAQGIELILVEIPASPNFLRLRHGGLTTRECEVLHWLAQGKRDAEIATILSAAPRTIGKHVEHILAKLGAENRGAAVKSALVWLDGHR